MADELFSVAEQVVLVSGASRGIGKAIAEAFAARDARVILTGRNEDTLRASVEQMEHGRHAPAYRVCDVASSSSIAATVDSVYEKYERIDTLINVAGVNRRKPALQITDEDYDFVMDINLRGAFVLSREVGRRMVEAGAGGQINIASLNTDRPLLQVAPYAMSKAAMGHMTRVLAMEWGPYGVRVNGIAPGFILTDLTQKLWSHEVMQQWGKANTPQRRLGRPEDLAGAAIFLASNAAAFMTGQTIYVDGGFSAGWNWPIEQTNPAKPPEEASD